ncbi:Hg(II)-responsive transcriptional regulator [Photobacterium frigidiphilum]|uniref:Mercuric resistance operon regulatory protein n=1 Tax=Photobacterium frigidiphilum TaxID=264736 RepID=A0A2T3J741_9GAMM|nr:Hg(II)-responsive transcriptional regulator [Photobacterium frigidiphilum]PSU44559.1 Hg(II)-responsive transcriptional regulator [Photobacterium frigidiphilum]
MKISDLAKAANVNVETIRYYERRGLITQPLKPEQGYREYSKIPLERIQFIKRAQELGFTLEEIANLLLLGEGHCLSVQEIAEHKLASVRAKIADLNRLESVLDNLVTQCKCNPSESSCPIVETLLPNDRK